MNFDFKKHALLILFGGFLIFAIAYLIFGGPLRQEMAPVEYSYNRLGKKGCCRICRQSVACGNSCVSRITVCDKPPGCACNQRVIKKRMPKK